MTGRIFAIVGPSGVGKDTLLHAVQKRAPDLLLVRRVITRPSALGGEDFDAVSEAEFDTRLAAGDFALHWKAHGLSYGIPANVLDALATDQRVLFNGSRAMLTEAARVFPGLKILHITASDTVLAERLRMRGRESDADIAGRLERARMPLPEGLDIVEIDNSGPLENAVAALLAVLEGEPALS